MTEELLNQEEGLFDDYEAEDMPVEAEESQAEESTEEPDRETVEESAQKPQEETQEAEEPFLNIKYDKQEYGLTKEEAKDLAEKGKNYERLFEKYSTLNSNIERIARMNNMDINTFLQELGNSTRNVEISKEVDALQSAYPDTDIAVLEELATKRVDERLNLQEQSFVNEQNMVANQQDQEIRRQLNLFRQEYPNLAPDKLDAKVYDYVKSGYTLLEAYNKWARSEGEKQKSVEDKKSKVSQLNEENKKKSLGSTSNVEGIEVDDFLEGFLNN